MAHTPTRATGSGRVLLPESLVNLSRRRRASDGRAPGVPERRKCGGPRNGLKGPIRRCQMLSAPEHFALKSA